MDLALGVGGRWLRHLRSIVGLDIEPLVVDVPEVARSVCAAIRAVWLERRLRALGSWVH